MSDVATLGLQVESGQVSSATAALKTFAGAANDAAASADRLNLGNGKLGPSMGVVESMAKRAGVPIEEMAARIKATSTSFEAFNTVQSRYVAAAQQVQQANAKSAAAANDNGRAVAGLTTAATDNESSFNRLANTLTRRVLYGFIAAEARQAIAAIVDLNAELAKTGDVLARTNISSSFGQGALSAAAGKGVDANALLDGFVKLNDQVSLSKQGLGEIGALLKANGIVVDNSKDAFLAIADLVQRAAGDYRTQVSILSQSGLPATREMVRVMEQGRTAILAQIDAAKKFSTDQLQAAQKLDDRWNAFWDDLKRQGKQATLEIFDPKNWTVSIDPGSPIDNFWQYMKDQAAIVKGKLQDAVNGSVSASGKWKPIGQNDFIGGAVPSGAVSSAALPAVATPPPVIDTTLLKQRIALEQQEISVLGQTASVRQQVRQQELSLQTALLSTNQFTQEQAQAWKAANDEGLKNSSLTKGQADSLRSLAQEQALGITQIKAQGDAYRVQAATIGMSVGAAAAYTAEQNRLNEAVRSHQPLSASDRAAIKAEAQAMGEAAQAAAQKAAQDKATFDQQTVFLSDTEKAIAAVQQQLHGDAWKDFMNDGLSATMRLTAGLKDLKDTGQQFATNFVQGMLQGKSAMDSLRASAQQLASKLADKAITDLLTGNYLQAGIEGIAAIGAALFGSSKKDDTAAKQAAQELQQAQDAWHGMTEQLIAFNQAAAGTKFGPLTNEIIQLQKNLSDLSLAAEKAQDFAAVPGLQNTFNEGVSRVVKEFVNGAPVLTDLQQKMADVSTEGQGLIQTLQQMGLASAQTVAGITAAIASQQAAIKQAFISSTENSLVADVRNNSGVGYLNTITDAIQKFNDLAAEGVNPNVLQAWLISTAQTAVDSAHIAGASYHDELFSIPEGNSDERDQHLHI